MFDEPIQIIDATAIRGPETADEALAIDLLGAVPGQFVVFHAPTCLSNLGMLCGCKVRLLRVGASA